MFKNGSVENVREKYPDSGSQVLNLRERMQTHNHGSDHMESEGTVANSYFIIVKNKLRRGRGMPSFLSENADCTVEN